MDFSLHEWLNLFVRWFHVVAGITWIGQTYLFNRLERTFSAADETWLVHGGGFYHVKKIRSPRTLPPELQWFKWESALTWLSGFLLLIIVYYMGGTLFEPESGLSLAQGICLSLGVLVLGWIGYVLLWGSPLGRNELLGAAVSWLLVIALAWLLGRTLSPRAAYLHIGAMLGTIMTANVWMRILPGQRKMVAALEKGELPDLSQGERGRRASRHNTYMSVPVVFLMISSHFPGTYGHPHSWAVLGALVLLGWAAARLIQKFA